MKQLLYFILIGCCHLASTQARTLTETDSLQLLLPTLPHDSTRLEVIRDILRIEQSNSKCIYFSDMLFEEATEQKNDGYAGIAIYFQLNYYYNQNELDSVSKRLLKMEPYARKANLWDFYFDAVRCEIDLYTYREQFEFAINKAFKLHEQAKKKNNIRGQIGAYQCLANAYIGTGRTQKGMEALEEAHKLLPQQESMSVHNVVLGQLIGLTRAMKDDAGLLKYLKEQEKLLNDYTTVNPSMKRAFYNPYLFNEVYYAYYYNDIKQSNRALEHLIAARKYLTPNSYFIYKVMYKDACATYYRACRNYDQALLYTDSTINEYKEILSNDYIHQLASKADILTEAGRSQEALPIYKEVLQAKDSLENELSDKQMKLIQENYQMDKLILEREQLKNRIQFLTLLFALLIAIVLSALTARLSRIRKALKLAEQQTREAMHTAQEANEMKNRFLSNMSYNIRIPLNGVVGFSQIIATQTDLDETSRQEFSTIIQKNSQELIRMVNDVLDLSRLEAKMTKFQLQENEVTAIANDAFSTACMQSNTPLHIRFQNKIREAVTIMTNSERLLQALHSALIYPQPCDVPREVTFTLSLTADKTKVCFRIQNSPLADPEFMSQEVAIRHDINRLLLELFEGSYTVEKKTPNGPTITIIYPVAF